MCNWLINWRIRIFRSIKDDIRSSRLKSNSSMNMSRSIPRKIFFQNFKLEINDQKNLFFITSSILSAIFILNYFYHNIDHNLFKKLKGLDPQVFNLRIVNNFLMKSQLGGSTPAVLFVILIRLDLSFFLMKLFFLPEIDQNFFLYKMQNEFDFEKASPKWTPRNL